MSKTKDNSKKTMRVALSAIGSFAIVSSTASFLMTNYSGTDLWSHSRSSFTEAEKKTMFQRSGPPREAIEAMSRMASPRSATPNAKIVSPWAKPQP